MKPNQAVQRIADILSPAPHLFVMIGVPGVGKSTFTSTLLAAVTGRTFVIASTDDLIDQYAALHGKTYSEAFGELNFKHLNQQMMQVVSDSITAKTDLLIDRTNMSKKSRKSFLQAAPDHVKVALNFSVDDKILWERLRERAERTGKNIPAMVVRSMFNNYERPTREEGFAHVIEIDNS